MYMYVYVCIYMYIYIYVYLDIFIHVYMYTQIYMYIYICIYIYTYKSSCIYRCTHMYIKIHVCGCAHKYILSTNTHTCHVSLCDRQCPAECRQTMCNAFGQIFRNHCNEISTWPYCSFAFKTNCVLHIIHIFQSCMQICK